jgi:hypothetical protein
MPHLTDAELTWTIQRQQEAVSKVATGYRNVTRDQFACSLLAALLELQSRRRLEQRQQHKDDRVTA